MPALMRAINGYIDGNAELLCSMILVKRGTSEGAIESSGVLLAWG